MHLTLWTSDLDCQGSPTGTDHRQSKNTLTRYCAVYSPVPCFGQFGAESVWLEWLAGSGNQWQAMPRRKLVRRASGCQTIDMLASRPWEASSTATLFHRTPQVLTRPGNHAFARRRALLCARPACVHVSCLCLGPSITFTSPSLPVPPMCIPISAFPSLWPGNH